MILTKLYELAMREKLVVKPNYQPLPVSYLIHLDKDGEFLGIVSTKSRAPTEPSKKPPAGKSFQVPCRSGRSGGTHPEFLCDKAEYVFGLVDVEDKNKEKAQNRANERRDAFRADVAAAAEATGDVALWAVVKFLDAVAYGKISIVLPDDLGQGDVFGFVYEPDGYDQLVSDRPVVEAYWGHLRGSRIIPAGTKESQCLITGERCFPVPKHPKVKGIFGCTQSGVPLVSFQEPAFASYGFHRSNNAPISLPAADAYSEALNRLLDAAYPDPVTGAPMPGRRVRISGDTVAVFWSVEQSDKVDLLPDFFRADPKVVEELCKSPWSGVVPDSIDENAFYMLTLTGVNGRAAVRDWYESSVSVVWRNIQQHFEDMRIVVPAWETQIYPIKKMVDSTVAKKSKGDPVLPAIAALLFGAIMKGRAYPYAIFEASIRRSRVERKVLPVRAAMIKGYLARAKRMNLFTGIPEVKMSLDRENTSVPYLLGRLFATLEKLQSESSNRASTIRDKFFSRAVSTPGMVFPTLMKRAIHDYKKSERRVYFQKEVQQIMAGIPGFPQMLNLVDQGILITGYYHQAQDFYTAKTETEIVANSEQNSGGCDE